MPVASPFVSLFEQAIHNRWRKRHDNLLSTLILTQCDPPLEKSWLCLWLNFPLGQLGLTALGVGVAGSCFFIALFGNPNHHFYIRQAAVQYLRDNPECSLEAIRRIHGMVTREVWCDVLIIQAVAESLNRQIYIVESHVNIGPVTLIDPHRSYIIAANRARL